MSPLRVVHVSTGLEVGGAEVALERLLRASDPARLQQRVVSLTTVGPVGARMRDAGIDVAAMGLTLRRPMPGVRQLAGLLAAARPHVVQTWMYHADVLGGWAARRAGGAALVWGVRNTDASRAATRATTLAVIRASARLSRRWPDRIVCVAEATRAAHVALGYDASRMVVIANGFRIPPPMPPRERLRADMGLDARALLVARGGRWHPHKDYATMCQAFAIVARLHPSARLVLYGPGITSDNGPLTQLVTAAGIQDVTDLLGVRDDVDRLHAAADVVVSSSFGEGFPNVVAEAMAVGTPVVTTDVGDAAVIVGATGDVVPPRDPAALASAIRAVLELDPAARAARGDAGRRRIATSFSIDATARAYADLYESLALSRREKRPGPKSQRRPAPDVRPRP